MGDFSSYGGFDFEGFTCSNSFAKRDQLTGRDFRSKCITGSASSEPESCPKASCSDVSSFSIDTIEISVEFDVELEFQYGMDDGSTCKQKCSCSSEGTSVQEHTMWWRKECYRCSTNSTSRANPPAALVSTALASTARAAALPQLKPLPHLYLIPRHLLFQPPPHL